MKRNPAVDALRGVAILLVLLLHFHLGYHLNRGLFAEFAPPKLLSAIFSNGNYGVVIFFVISGFLITSTTLGRFGELARVRLRDFYAFRAGRILPCLALMATLVSLFAFSGVRIFQNDPGGPSFALTLGSLATFTHNLLMEKFGYFNYCLNVLWSLSVEEAFYLFFPLLCICLRRPRWIALAWASFVVISPYYRYLHRDDSTDIYGLYDYLACFDGLAIGCLVAIARHSLRVPGWADKLRLPALALIAYIYCQGIWSHVVFGISAVSLLTGLFLLGSRGEHSPRALAPLRALGRYSYELYLFHVVILAWMKTLVKEADLGLYGKPALLALFLATSMLVAMLISRFYAEPLNRKLRKALGSKAGVVRVGVDYWPTQRT